MRLDMWLVTLLLVYNVCPLRYGLNQKYRLGSNLIELTLQGSDK